MGTKLKWKKTRKSTRERLGKGTCRHGSVGAKQNTKIEEVIDGVALEYVELQNNRGGNRRGSVETLRRIPTWQKVNLNFEGETTT